MEGPINGTSGGKISMKDLVGLIEKETGGEAILTGESSDENHSPYGIESSWVMANTKARSLGFQFSNLHDWLPGLIADAAEQLKANA